MVTSLKTPMTSPETETATRGAELVTTDGRSLPLVSAALRGEAHGGIARLVLEQRFENRHDEALRVTYRMPLPADGAVSAYAFELDGRVIAGEIDRKASARERFEEAVASGRTAALLEQDRADIFTQEIGNIPPGCTVLARITVDQKLAWLPEGEWELRFPTVIGPRYVGTTETEADVAATAIAVAADGVSARVQIQIAIRDDRTGAISSPSHVLTHVDDTIPLRSAKLDRDIVLRWPVAAKAVGCTLATARPATGAHATDAYGLLTIVPPAPDAKLAALPRDLIVLLDTSGSMGGTPLDKAKRVVAMLIESLGDADRLELIEFSSTARRYLGEPVLATERARRDAIAWVRKRSAGGGTEMHGVPCSRHIRAMRPDAQRQVILVTDGYIGGEQQIVRLLVEGLPMASRLHVVGVGSAANRALAIAMARAGRGAEVLVGLDEDCERAAKRLVDKTRAPVVTDLELSGGALLDSAPVRLPDVFAGSPVVAAVRVSADGGVLVIKGKAAREPYTYAIDVPPRRAGDGEQGIVALYGRERVADLEARATYDVGEGPSIDREIEDLGLQFQIATRLTSWVAIDEKRSVAGPGRHEVMPQEVPYGTTAESFGLRAQARITRAGAVDELAAHAPVEKRRVAKTMMVSGYAAPQAMAPPPSGYPSYPQQMQMPAIAGKKRTLVWPVATIMVLLLAIIALLIWWLEL